MIGARVLVVGISTALMFLCAVILAAGTRSARSAGPRCRPAVPTSVQPARAELGRQHRVVALGEQRRVVVGGRALHHDARWASPPSQAETQLTRPWPDQRADLDVVEADVVLAAAAEGQPVVVDDRPRRAPWRTARCARRPRSRAGPRPSTVAPLVMAVCASLNWVASLPCAFCTRELRLVRPGRSGRTPSGTARRTRCSGRTTRCPAGSRATLPLPLATSGLSAPSAENVVRELTSRRAAGSGAAELLGLLADEPLGAAAAAGGDDESRAAGHGRQRRLSW